ncbi:hypothetical protein O6H91_Y070000 [Diphasiastrum complanatum]|nr:hypothetical protein O6H91_Y070000 [Diphasiastrum complanatum]
MNREHTRIMTRHGGTIGYLAPECSLEHSPITPKIDVFSYGMVLLEIVGGRKNYISEYPETLKNYFPAWAMEKMKSGASPEIVDPSLGGDFDISQVELLVQIAFWCINDRPEVRPSMGLVLRMLERLVPVDQPVPRPNYFDDISGSQREDEGQPSSGSQREDEEQPVTTGSTFSIAVI